MKLTLIEILTIGTIVISIVLAIAAAVMAFSGHPELMQTLNILTAKRVYIVN